MDDYFDQSGKPLDDQYRAGTERSIKPDKTFNSSDTPSDISAGINQNNNSIDSTDTLEQLTLGRLKTPIKFDALNEEDFRVAMVKKASNDSEGCNCSVF